jgi:glycosyltransferase involved in cell wall biosynthesis
MLSVIIPSYNDPYLKKTIESVLNSAKDDIEVIVVLDGGKLHYVVRDNRVKYIHLKENIGMRGAINTGVKKADGKYIMKLDSHCDIDEGFDIKLKESTDENTVSVPSRYNLNVKIWGKYNGPIDFLYLKYPDNLKRVRFRMELFQEKIERKDNKQVEEIITFQGACWFMQKNFFNKIGGLYDKKIGSFGAEAHEICMKAWLTTENGRVVRNRNTWYAHYRPNNVWKNKPANLRKIMLKSMRKVFEFDMLNKWPNQKRPFKWVIDKFGPLPDWPEDWHKRDYSNFNSNNH